MIGGTNATFIIIIYMPLRIKLSKRCTRMDTLSSSPTDTLRTYSPTDEPGRRFLCQNVSIYVGLVPCGDYVPWCVVVRDLHVESAATVTQVLGRQHGALLTDEQCSAVGIAANIVGADGQISDLQTLDTVHVETLVKHTVLDDAVALLGSHGARAQGVPGGLDVAL